MIDSDPRQLMTNALPLIAVVLMASGIFVKTLPLVSKRPPDIELAKISHAGRQDVEARLWQDPFMAMRGVKSKKPATRCSEAIKDPTHHPSTLTKQIDWRQTQSKERGQNHLISVLPIMVSGGPYFEDGEARRRIRYATVMALLKTRWEPFREDKLGFVWTFESCEEAPWRRHLPELLPYEWFKKNDKWLLVLWIDEDAVTRRPLFAMQKLTELIKNGGVPCQSPNLADEAFWSRTLSKILADKVVCTKPTKHPKDVYETKLYRISLDDVFASDTAVRGGLNKNEAPTAIAKPATTQITPLTSPPWKRMPVIGPWTSATLHGLVADLARDIVRRGPPTSSASETQNKPLFERFYSASTSAQRF